MNSGSAALNFFFCTEPKRRVPVHHTDGDHPASEISFTPQPTWTPADQDRGHDLLQQHHLGGNLVQQHHLGGATLQDGAVVKGHDHDLDHLSIFGTGTIAAAHGEPLLQNPRTKDYALSISLTEEGGMFGQRTHWDIPTSLGCSAPGGQLQDLIPALEPDTAYDNVAEAFQDWPTGADCALLEPVGGNEWRGTENLVWHAALAHSSQPGCQVDLGNKTITGIHTTRSSQYESVVRDQLFFNSLNANECFESTATSCSAPSDSLLSSDEDGPDLPEQYLPTTSSPQRSRQVMRCCPICKKNCQRASELK